MTENFFSSEKDRNRTFSTTDDLIPRQQSNGMQLIEWLEHAIPCIGQYYITVLYFAAGNVLYDLIGNDYAISDVVVNFVAKSVFGLKFKRK
jgi:hypothetical protein